MLANSNPTQTYTSPMDSQIHLYGPQQISPAQSASTTPVNVSPTSPRNPNMLPHLPLAARQIRPPKSPMYIPAVLRPTERPHRPSPPTPPRSLHGSTDSFEGEHLPKSLSRTHTSTSDPIHKSILSQPLAENPHPSPVLGDVTGPPTRSHWKPDANALICDAPICQKSFSLFERRHHCRHCGHVFCNTHSHHTVPLDQDAEFHPKGSESRACKHCWERYCRWRNARTSRPGSVSESSLTVKSTPVIGMKGQSQESKTPVAGSGPRDWNWSTF